MLQHLHILITAYFLEKVYKWYQSHTIIWLFQRKGVTLQRFLVQLLRFQNKTERYCCTLHYYNYEKIFPTISLYFVYAIDISSINLGRMLCVGRKELHIVLRKRRWEYQWNLFHGFQPSLCRGVYILFLCLIRIGFLLA